MTTEPNSEKDQYLPAVIGKSHLSQTIVDGRQTVADAIDISIKGLEFSKEIAEATPIGWAVKLFDLASTYKANRFQRNVTSFLAETDRMKLSQRVKFAQRLGSNEAFSEKFAEVTFLIWEDSETPFKARIVGRLAYSLGVGILTNKEYLRYSLLVKSASIPGLEALESFLDQFDNVPGASIPHFEQESLLFSCGFGVRYGTGFDLTKDGISIAKYGLDIDVLG